MSYTKDLVEKTLRGGAAVIAFACAMCAFAPSAHAYRVVIYWQGWDAGTMEIQQNSNPPMQIPEGACGFRLQKPGAGSDPDLNWDDAWYFAQGDLLGSPLDGYTSDDWNDPEYIQATGPVNGCNTNNYLFHTPPTVTTSFLAPAEAGAFVAEFFTEGHIEWLDQAGDVIVPEDPPGGGGGDGGGGCDWCTIPPSLVACFQDWEGNWQCEDEDDDDGQILDLLTVFRYYVYSTVPDLSDALTFVAKRDYVAAGESLRNASIHLKHAGQVVKPFRVNSARLEYGTYARGRRTATKTMMREAAGAIGAFQVRFDECGKALGKAANALGRGGGREEILAAQEACADASIHAGQATDAVLALRAGGLPAEKNSIGK